MSDNIPRTIAKSTYRITVRSISNGNILTFKNVQSYFVEGGFIIFTDVKTGKTKRFSTTNVEIEEESVPLKRRCS